MSSPLMMPSQAPGQGAVVAKPQLHEEEQNYDIKRSDTATTGTSTGSPSHNNNNNNNKSTDDTLSTANCDDSLTASVNMSGTRLYAPPVFAVNVDKRSVRQRLRDQEAKITALLHPHPRPITSSSSAAEPPSSPASEGVLLKLVQTLEQDLKKTEAEKTKMQEELEQLQKKMKEKAATTNDNSDNDMELATVKVDNTAATAVTEQVEKLQLELRRKTHETLLLQDRWESTLQRMVKYQTDLETHDLHYTDYAAQQFQAGDEALEELRELTSKDQPPANRQLGKRAKHMMSTLLKDLEVLGERYQESRVNQEQELAHWKQKHLESQHKAQVLEATLKEHAIAIPEEEATVTEETSTPGPLMSVQESGRTETPDDLYAQAQAAEQEAQHVQMERDALQEEVARLQHTMTQLQTVTQQQQDALQAAAMAAAEREAAETKKKKKLFSFGKKKRKESASSRIAAVPAVDVAAALAPMQSESQRFDRFQEQLQSQSQAFEDLRRECKKQVTQKAQLQQTVTELRAQQESAIAEHDNRALRDLQALFDELQAQQRTEREAAQAELEDLRAQLESSKSSVVEPSDPLHFS